MDQFDAGDYHDKFSDFYQLLGVIDKGAFGTVVRAVDKYTGEEVAVKIIAKSNFKSTHAEHLKREAQILRALDHPNVIAFRHMKETQTRIFLAMELVTGTNLLKLLQTENLSESQAHCIFSQLMEGVKYLHGKHIIHRDLKPENILVSPELSVKITDFGLSAQADYKQSLESGKCGTLIYMAPEQKLEQYYSTAIDVWSCGLILYMLLAGGQHPLASQNDNTETYIHKLRSPQWVIPEGFPSAATSLFLKMVAPAPLERYSANQALAHPWVTKQGNKVPMTVTEEFEAFQDALVLKTVVFAVLFGRTAVSAASGAPAEASSYFLEPPRVTIRVKKPSSRQSHIAGSWFTPIRRRTIIKGSSIGWRPADSRKQCSSSRVNRPS